MAEKVDIYFKFFPRDYLADTMRLTTEQHGAYLLLMIELWILQGEPLPDDADELARITRVPAKRWPTVWKSIQRYFTKAPNGGWMQGRIGRELEAAREAQILATESGKRGAQKRWGKNGNPNAVPNGGPIGDPIREGSSPPYGGTMALHPPSATHQSESVSGAREDRVEPVTGKPGPLWTSQHWFGQFKAAWCEKYARTGYGVGGTADAKAHGDLGDMLDAMEFPDLQGAQERAAEMIAEFLSDTDTKLVKARHPWSWFVARFNGLATPAPKAAPSPIPERRPTPSPPPRAPELPALKPLPGGEAPDPDKLAAAFAAFDRAAGLATEETDAAGH